MHNKPEISQGVTLPEIIISVFVAGVLMAFAVPSFISVINDNRMSSAANQLITSLAYSRSEAIKRGQQVTIKHKGATEKLWEQGWDIFTDNNGNGIMDMSDVLLKTFDELPEGYTLRSGYNFANWVAYLATGSFRSGSGFVNDTFRLCDSTKQISKSRAIIVKMGRVRTEIGKVKECP